MAEKWILDILGPSPFDLKLSDCPSHISCAFKGERLRGWELSTGYLRCERDNIDISYLSTLHTREISGMADS